MNDPIKENVMPVRSRYNMILRTIAWVVLITFSWQQITYGADLASRRWESREKKVGRTYSLIEAIQQQKKQGQYLKNQVHRYL